jgi:hypothetical protein
MGFSPIPLTTPWAWEVPGPPEISEVRGLPNGLVTATTTAVGREDVIAWMTQAVENSRADYLRMKQAGNEVTANELAETRGAYEKALERLSRALHAGPARADC